MSQLAMASASHSMQNAQLSTKVVAVTHKYSCSDLITGQTCPDTVCQCDASVSAMVFPVAVSQSSAPQISNISSSLQNSLNRVPAVIVPPPIPSL